MRNTPDNATLIDNIEKFDIGFNKNNREIDKKVLQAMRKVDRKLFVPANRNGSANPDVYENYPLSIGHDQTISQPYIVAYMTSALELAPAHSVLEIGTGSGYQAAILSNLCQSVYTVEIIEEFTLKAQQLLSQLNYTNIYLKNDDGNLGWEQDSLFDRIIITASMEKIPSRLKDQLKIGGIMIVPVVDKATSSACLYKIVRNSNNSFRSTKLMPVRFVPIVIESYDTSLDTNTLNNHMPTLGIDFVAYNNDIS